MGDMSGWSALWGPSGAPYLAVMTHSVHLSHSALCWFLHCVVTWQNGLLVSFLCLLSWAEKLLMAIAQEDCTVQTFFVAFLVKNLHLIVKEDLYDFHYGHWPLIWELVQTKIRGPIHQRGPRSEISFLPCHALSDFFLLPSVPLICVVGCPVWMLFAVCLTPVLIMTQLNNPRRSKYDRWHVRTRLFGFVFQRQ